MTKFPAGRQKRVYCLLMLLPGKEIMFVAGSLTVRKSCCLHQIVWTQIRPNKTSDQNWIQTVCHSDDNPEMVFRKS